MSGRSTKKVAPRGGRGGRGAGRGGRGRGQVVASGEDHCQGSNFSAITQIAREMDFSGSSDAAVPSVKPTPSSKIIDEVATPDTPGKHNHVPKVKKDADRGDGPVPFPTVKQLATSATSVAGSYSYFTAARRDNTENVSQTSSANTPSKPATAAAKKRGRPSNASRATARAAARTADQDSDTPKAKKIKPVSVPEQVEEIVKHIPGERCNEDVYNVIMKDGTFRKGVGEAEMKIISPKTLRAWKKLQ